MYLEMETKLQQAAVLVCYVSIIDFSLSQEASTPHLRLWACNVLDHMAGVRRLRVLMNPWLKS